MWFQLWTDATSQQQGTNYTTQYSVYWGLSPYIRNGQLIFFSDGCMQGATSRLGAESLMAVRRKNEIEVNKTPVELDCVYFEPYLRQLPQRTTSVYAPGYLTTEPLHHQISLKMSCFHFVSVRIFIFASCIQRTFDLNNCCSSTSLLYLVLIEDNVIGKKEIRFKERNEQSDLWKHLPSLLVTNK